jgi:tRNA uridine 5-carbamoylmethylation protein Kti12
MPFVMMVGLPSSGKTYYTNILKDYLENQLKKTVKVISDEKFYYEDKNSIYMGKNFNNITQE